MPRGRFIERFNPGTGRFAGSYGILSAPALILCLFLLTGLSGRDDLEIFKKACEKALGEKTTDGAPRIISLERSVIRGEDTLFVSANAQRHFTDAGLRNNALTDVATILRIAKSWGWGDKVGRIAIVMCLSRDGNSFPLFSCSISHDALVKVDWSSVNSKAVSGYLNDVKFYEVKK